MIFIIGTGIGDSGDLGKRVVEVLESADFIMGFKHSLSILRSFTIGAKILELDIHDVLDEEGISGIVSELRKYESAVLLVSGNPLLFSYAKKVMDSLDTSEYEVLPAVSSVVYLASKVGVDINDICMVSGHNAPDIRYSHARVLSLLHEGCIIGYFVKGVDDYYMLCRRLSNFDVTITAGFELGTAGEVIHVFSPSDDTPPYEGRRCVLIVRGRGFCLSKFPGNEELEFDGIPISRWWSRSLVVHALNPVRGEIIWDLGAGSGATSIWISSLVGSSGRVYAVERVKARYELLERNVFAYPNIVPILGDVLEVLGLLPLPDAIHIGGGMQKEILRKIFSECSGDTRFASAIATVDSLGEFSAITDIISFDVEMYMRFSSRLLGKKRAFVGEHVLYVLKGVVL